MFLVATLTLAVLILSGVIGAFLIGFYSNPAWAKVRGTREYRLVVVIRPFVKAIAVVFHISIAVVVVWLLFMVAGSPLFGGDFPGEALLFLAPGVPAALYYGLFSEVLQQAKLLSVANREGGVRTLNRSLSVEEDRNCIVLARAR